MNKQMVLFVQFSAAVGMLNKGNSCWFNSTLQAFNAVLPSALIRAPGTFINV